MNDISSLSPDRIKIKLGEAARRLKELERIIQDTEEEKGRLEYMFSYLSDSQQPAMFSQPTRAPRQNKKAIYTEIFKEHPDDILHTNDVFDFIKKKGFPITKGTHDANLSSYQRDRGMPIERVRMGYYKYNPTKAV